MNNLRNDILNACRGYERDHILSILKSIIDDNTPSVVQNRFGMKPCPVCGSTEVFITDIMFGITRNDPRIVAKVGICDTCHYEGPSVRIEHLPKPCTEAAWTKLVVNAWNNDPTVSMFQATERAVGKEYQFDLLGEEIFELVIKLSTMGMHIMQDKRSDRDVDILDIISEMADVIILIYQWLYSKGLDFGQLDDVMKEKVERTCNHESVHTAIVELSRKVTEMTTTTNVHTADADSTHY